MGINVTCHQCGTEFTVKGDLAGRRAKCRKCGGTITIPSNAEVKKAPQRDAPQSNAYDLASESAALQKSSGRVPEEYANPSSPRSAGDTATAGMPATPSSPLGNSSARACPACGGAIQPNTVLCVACGLDLRSGKRIATKLDIQADYLDVPFVTPITSTLPIRVIAGLVQFATVVLILLAVFLRFQVNTGAPSFVGIPLLAVIAAAVIFTLLSVVLFAATGLSHVASKAAFTRYRAAVSPQGEPVLNITSHFLRFRICSRSINLHDYRAMRYRQLNGGISTIGLAIAWIFVVLASVYFVTGIVIAVQEARFPLQAAIGFPLLLLLFPVTIFLLRRLLILERGVAITFVPARKKVRAFRINVAQGKPDVEELHDLVSTVKELPMDND